LYFSLLLNKCIRSTSSNFAMYVITHLAPSVQEVIDAFLLEGNAVIGEPVVMVTMSSVSVYDETSQMNRKTAISVSNQVSILGVAYIAVGVMYHIG
jgi:hypothetical protein